MSPAGPVAALHEVRKRYGPVQALDGLSMEVRAGEITALLGPNGAGKSTALSLLTGLRRPDGGTARLFGADPCLPRSRRRLGTTLQDCDFPATLRVGELVALAASHFERPAKAPDLLHRFGLEPLAARRAGGLSGGERRRLALALAFAGDPDLAVLDEPTTGVDVEARQDLWRGVRRAVGAGAAVLLSTHYLEEAEAVADRVLVLGRGRLLADGSVAGITGSIDLKRVGFLSSDPPELEGAVRLERRGERWLVWTRDADALVREMVARELPFSALEVRPASLEEAFLVLTGEDR